jgi:hypothetical protein
MPVRFRKTILLLAAVVVALVTTAQAQRGNRQDALDDLRAARQGAKEDAARQAAEEATNPQMYWLDYHHDGSRFDTREMLIHGDYSLGLQLFSSFAECQAGGEFWKVNTRGYTDRWKCRPTAVTLKMRNSKNEICGRSGAGCKDAEKAIAKILYQEIEGKLLREPEFWK